MSHNTYHLLAAILVCILAVLICLWFAERQMKEYGQQGDDFLAPWSTEIAAEFLYQQTVFGDIVNKDYTDPVGDAFLAPYLRDTKL